MSRLAIYPFADLEIGQCFTIPLDRVTAGTVNNLCYVWGLRLGRKFSYHTTPDGYLVERINPTARPAFAISAAPPRNARAAAQANVDAIARRLRSEG